MINTNMRAYNYYTYGTDDEYGQPSLSDSATGTVNLSISLTSQSIQDNINYKDCNYIGITMNKNIDDTYVIAYGTKKLKVLYVNDSHKYSQIFMQEM